MLFPILTSPSAITSQLDLVDNKTVPAANGRRRVVEIGKSIGLTGAEDFSAKRGWTLVLKHLYWDENCSQESIK